MSSHDGGMAWKLADGCEVEAQPACDGMSQWDRRRVHPGIGEFVVSHGKEQLESCPEWLQQDIAH